MFNENEISLTEATILALQGKLKLEETRQVRKPKRKVENKEVKTEDIDVTVNNTTVSQDDMGNTVVETEDATVVVTDKKENEEAIEGPAEDFINSDETIDVPVEGDETIVPEEEVSEEAIEEITDEPEDIEEESKGLEENKEVKTEGFANDGDSIFGLKINCNNPTFGFSDDESDGGTKVYPELARILQKIAEKIKSNGVSDNETITDSDGKVIGKYGFGYEGVLDPFEESKEIGKSDKVCSGEKCENCKKTEAKSLKKESKLTDYIDEEDLDKIIKNNSYLTKIGCKNYEAIPDMKLSVSTKGYTDFDKTFKVVRNADNMWEVYEIDGSGKKIGDTFLLNESKEVKTEARPTFDKKSFEEALTKFYKFNNEKVESFKVEKVLQNKAGNLKIEGKLNNKIPVTMKFNKKLEGKSFIKYTLAGTNNILKESKEIVTNMMLSNKENKLECKYIISR